MVETPTPPRAAALALRTVGLRFGALKALDAVNLELAPGDFVALVGPSGCGKSTVLRLLAGLLTPTAGTVVAPAVAAADIAAATTAFVFQEPTLMPWARVADNVGLPLRLSGMGPGAIRAAVAPVLQTVGLAEFAQAYPAQLSGGMKMRASIARALVTQPRVLLMDEPFAALDDITRQRLQADLLHWWARGRPSTVFVTHQVAEAVYLSRRVLVMSPRPGRIVADIPVLAPHPRDSVFRRTDTFVETCRQVSAALEAALA